MIIKSVDQILPFLTYVQIRLKSAKLKGMQLWAECNSNFFFSLLDFYYLTSF